MAYVRTITIGRPPAALTAAISEEQAWTTVGLGFLGAIALKLETGSWDGLALPIFLIILFAVVNHQGGDE